MIVSKIYFNKVEKGVILLPLYVYLLGKVDSTIAYIIRATYI